MNKKSPIAEKTEKDLTLFREFCELNNLDIQDILNLTANCMANIFGKKGCPEKLITRLGMSITACVMAIDKTATLTEYKNDK